MSSRASLDFGRGKGDDYKPDLMRYLVGGVLIRGAIYYYATVLRKEATDYLEFFVHLALLTLGVIIFVTKFSPLTTLPGSFSSSRFWRLSSSVTAVTGITGITAMSGLRPKKRRKLSMPRLKKAMSIPSH